MAEIIPAILPKSPEELREKAELVDDLVPLVHIDVLEEDVWDYIDSPFEAHLMIPDPASIMRLWVERGASRIVVHDATEDILEHRHEVEIGLGVEMDVPLEDIFDFVTQVDFIQLMAIREIGGQGRPFEDGIFDRIRRLKSEFPGTIVSVDGGINLLNADELMLAGADRLVVGSAIFTNPDPIDALEQFISINL